jgi:hypothetical protein
MPSGDPRQQRLERLRQWHTRPEPDLSLSFLREQFKRDVEKPYKQLAQVAAVWSALVPAALAAHCRLVSLSRGVLRVAVEDSAHLYELDRLLRQGLERQVRTAAKGPAIHRVQLAVASTAADGPAPGHRKATTDDAG